MGIGKRIKEARLYLNLTQEELGALVGVTGSAITNYEKETSHPKEEVLYKIISALKVDANYLFQDVVPLPEDAKKALTKREREHMQKYRVLDDHGKQIIDVVTDIELERIQNIQAEYLMPQAAHNDKAEDPEEQDLTNEDLGDL